MTLRTTFTTKLSKSFMSYGDLLHLESFFLYGKKESRMNLVSLPVVSPSTCELYWITNYILLNHIFNRMSPPLHFIFGFCTWLSLRGNSGCFFYHARNDNDENLVSTPAFIPKWRHNTSSCINLEDCFVTLTHERTAVCSPGVNE